MEVKIGIQHAPRELVVDTDETAEAVEKLVAEAVGVRGRARADRHQGPQGRRPGAKIAYVEIGGGVAGQVGFRS